MVGTALALQLGHRISEDFDFFSSSSFDAERLRSRLSFFWDLKPSDPDVWVHRKRDNLEAFVNPRRCCEGCFLQWLGHIAPGGRPTAGGRITRAGRFISGFG
jgi:hypothetical protein